MENHLATPSFARMSARHDQLEIGCCPGDKVNQLVHEFLGFFIKSQISNLPPPLLNQVSFQRREKSSPSFTPLSISNLERFRSIVLGMSIKIPDAGVGC